MFSYQLLQANFLRIFFCAHFIGFCFIAFRLKPDFSIEMFFICNVELSYFFFEEMEKSIHVKLPDSCVLNLLEFLVVARL